ncbi:MAG: glycosyltransferase, partial [bacterium]
EVDQKQYGHIYRLAEQPGVIMHGSVGQRQLTAELTKCKVLAYPNIFPETCCTAAMEALAAGCAVVTSQLACMAETVGPGGVLISGIPGTDEYNDSFVENCIRLLTDHTFWRKTASAGRDWILNYFTWDKVAKDWSAQLNQFQLKSQKKVDSVKGWHPKKDSKTNKNRDLIKSVSRKKTPTWQPLNLVFADDSWPYDGNTPANSPLDGPHSALVYLTKELAALGHEVHVYNNCLHAGIYQGVHYHRFDELAMANNYIYADAFIGLRNPWLFMNWLNAGVRILWAQDNFDQPHLQALKTNEDVRKNIDTIFCVTRWQAGNFLRHFHWDPEKMIVTRNGVCPHFFPKEFTEPKNNRLVYTSAPYRGLELLLKLFPEIYQATPTAELHVFSSLQIYQQSKEEDEKAYGHIYKLGKQPGVVMHGAIGQKELARELVQSKVLAYPNSYLEPSSIAVMEALAGGCAVVTSNLAALPETVGPGGVLIAGIPDTADYNDAFVENCVRLLKDHTFWGKTALAGREWLLEHNTWKKVALEWSGQISNLIHQTKTKMDNLTGWKSAVSWLD